MSAKVRIYIKQKGIKLPVGARLLIRRTCNAVLGLENFQSPAEVDVSIVDDSMIKEINREQRKIDLATDVLSFPLGVGGEFDTNPETGAKMLGDIVISIDHAVHQAKLYGHGIKREIAYLTAHSMFHLLGYDHEDDGLQREIMREKEEVVMENLGLAVTKV